MRPYVLRHGARSSVRQPRTPRSVLAAVRLHLVKVIFSRKGMDSAWGGCPSPILPDGRLVSLPIPDDFGPLYDELQFDDASSYGDVLRSLGRSDVRFPGKGLIPVSSARAHLDPDLVEKVVVRRDGWRPAFGQVAGAQTHLSNRGVGVGDLFLFFGWYRQTAIRHERLQYQRGSRHLHVLWGYLEVGEVVTSDHMATLQGAVADHPHVALGDRKRFAVNNTLYVGSDRLGLDPSLPGAGAFASFSDALVLTKPGSTRSVWSLPADFHPSRTAAPMSGNLPESWTFEEDGRVELRSTPIGQEFVVDTNEGILRWVTELVRRATDVRR